MVNLQIFGTVGLTHIPKEVREPKETQKKVLRHSFLLQMYPNWVVEPKIKYSLVIPIQVTDGPTKEKKLSHHVM